MDLKIAARMDAFGFGAFGVVMLFGVISVIGTIAWAQVPAAASVAGAVEALAVLAGIGSTLAASLGLGLALTSAEKKIRESYDGYQLYGALSSAQRIGWGWSGAALAAGLLASSGWLGGKITQSVLSPEPQPLAVDKLSAGVQCPALSYLDGAIPYCVSAPKGQDLSKAFTGADARKTVVPGLPSKPVQAPTAVN